MFKEKKRNVLYIILFALTLICILSFSYLTEKYPIVGCEPWGFSSSGKKGYTNPVKVVVEPWLGRHHVYALFNIPIGYINDKLFSVKIDETETYCGIFITGGDKEIAGVFPQPGHYLMQGMLNTRIAIGLIFQGQGDKLKEPENWQVGYSKVNQ